MIGNPQHQRFYPDGLNDRMPAFAEDPQHPETNLLSPRELNLLADWLRGQWYRGDGIPRDLVKKHVPKISEFQP